MSDVHHPLQVRLAHALLRKAERSEGRRAVSLALDQATLPELHTATTPEALTHVELLLQQLCACGAVQLKTTKPRPFQTLAERRPTLVLIDPTALATWSKFEPTAPRWSRQLVQAIRGQAELLRVPNAPALLDYLGRNPLPAFETMSPTECVALLNALATDVIGLGNLPCYLRELSAKHFHGHSKVLDSREELLRLLGANLERCLEVPIQLLVDLPPTWAGEHVLFIENAVSFERLAGQRQGTWAQAALIYAAGFRGAAKRLRHRGGSSLYWRGRPDDAQAQGFEAWLYDDISSPCVRFYGDLDFAGLQILAQLRQSFPTCQAWQPGYQALLQRLSDGLGHPPQVAGKQGQTAPLATGCPYADRALLPALHQTGHCVDQEAWPELSVSYPPRGASA